MREIPYNYTSADDRQVIRFLFDDDTWSRLEGLRTKRVTGRSARLLMRIIGDLFVLKRNAFMIQDLLDNRRRQAAFFGEMRTELKTLKTGAGDNEDVLLIVERCAKAVDEFAAALAEAPARRALIRKKLGAVIGEENVLFDPFALVSHATDATDWRLCLPAAVVRPDREEQVTSLLSAIRELGLYAIPRGAGTGLTGGAVPLREGCVMVNTEKLNRIRGIKGSTISLEAGVITDDAIEYALNNGKVFATDPTSAWASTIGGNIAENAGGKMAVLWGTAIDNVLSYRMALSNGTNIVIRRLDHPGRKIRPEDGMEFEMAEEGGRVLQKFSLKGSDIRKPGLWKDVTNKALGGLPGLQKEGTDGIITSAEFILHEPYPHRRTFCMEFYGDDMDEASRVILDISRAFEPSGEEKLMALEHFDDQYVRAVGYKNKAPRAHPPKAVLLIDLVGNTQEQLGSGTNKLEQLLKPYPNTCLFAARDEAEATRFWQDRKRLGAIAAHTNAFKLNEDIVLPLESLARFARYVDERNNDENRHNQRWLAAEFGKLIESATVAEDAEWFSEKIPQARALCAEAAERLAKATPEELRGEGIVHELRNGLGELLSGYRQIETDLDAIQRHVRSRRIVLATHMHAGDGNVHLNIPVFSNDREMMERAAREADEAMRKAVEMGGVVSGEHGIGITKLRHLEPERIRELDAHRKKLDPDGVLNPGKLQDVGVLDSVFTPSFNLLELEARILQHGLLEELALKIAKCVRCGKCKADCCVFYPAKNMFYHPRNKNLAIGALIEALLYNAQRSRSTRFECLRFLEDIADHCTACHKCLKPCPVDIDTGEVSVLERNILKARRFKHTPPQTQMTLAYLESRSPTFNRAFRAGVLRAGSACQRLAHRVASAMPESVMKLVPAHELLDSPMPPAPAETLRDKLPVCKDNQALSFKPEGQAKAAVFYFPGCGSERLFSDISLASLYLLIKTGNQVVIPPPFLCCGFPAFVNADRERHSRIVLHDTIVFSQIREMFRYLNFDACVVSCGTCMESLRTIGLDAIFECPIRDVSDLVFSGHGEVPGGGAAAVYHAPCHDSLAGGGRALIERCGASRVEAVPHCCSEAGTLALSRPDISSSMLKRKADALKAATEKAGTKLVLTNCPSCIQGLGRNRPWGIEPRHLAVEFAQRLGGAGWMDELQTFFKAAEVTTF
jgi:D-lactate dehydrogenase (cytochrome)